MTLCLLLSLIPAISQPAQASAGTHTIALSSIQNTDGSYSHSVTYDGQSVTEYDYTWHADPSTVHDEVSNSPAEYYTGTQPGNEAVYVAHDIYYYPELDSSRFTKTTYDGEQEWVYYYTATGYTDYIFSTLPGRSSLPTDMMHSADEAYENAVLHITQPGSYIIEGTWHGQIWVDLANYCDDPFTDPTAKVELILGGVDITCTVAAGVVFNNVYECDNTWEDQSSWSHVVDTADAGAVVTLADGTVNNVSGTNIFRILKTQYKSGSTSVQKKRLKIDGAFYSYQSMNIQGQSAGTGVLNITSGFEGLNSELHLTINSGNVYINSQDDGINVNEDNVSVLTINGGNLHILAGLGQEGDGVDSNGFICVNGGTTISMANPGADSGMDSDFGTYVLAGNVVALGSTMDWATNDSSVSYTHSVMNLQFSSSKSAGDAIVITDTNGNGVFAYDPDKDEITGAKTRTYTGAIVSCDAFEIGQSYHVYIGGEVAGTETMGVYDMSTVTGVSGTYQQSYGSTSTGGSGGFPGSNRPGSSGSTSTGSNTTFTFTSNVNKFSGVGNYGSTSNITITPTDAPETPETPEVTEKTYYLFGYINGANYACEEDSENMGAYKFVDGKLTATFESDSYVAVKEQDNANWYMFQSYVSTTSGKLYNTSTGAAEKMLVPGNVTVNFTLTENSDGSLTLSYEAESTECSHSYTSQVTTQATCTTDGVRTYTCSKCGDSYTESIAATGHSYVGGVCTLCGDTQSTGTTEGGYILVTDISEITSGGQFVIAALMDGTYKALDTTISSKISGVDITVTDNVANGDNLPVWTIEAVDGGIALSVDGSYLSYKSSTSFTSSTTAYAWTATAGYSGYVFNSASTNRGIYYRTSQSQFGAYSTFNAGFSSYISELQVFKYQAPTACAHSYTSQVTTAATCLAAGVRTYTCSKCGHSYTEEIAATGHDYEITVVAPTCENNGYTVHACKNCSYSYNDTPVNPIGHNETAVVTAPTCTEKGYTTYTCLNCGQVRTWNETAATGHSFVNGSCTVCGAADPNAGTTEYYLIGYINGANYGCEEDWENPGQYQFVNGKLTATFEQDSYVFIKTGDNANWYMFNEYCQATSGTLVNTNKGSSEKMFVPGGVAVTFTLVENADDSLTLSYTTASSSVVTPTLTVKNPTLAFEDEILYNVYFNVDDMSSVVEMGMVTFATRDANGTVTNAVDIIPGYLANTDGTYTVHSNGIPAKMLSDALYFKVYAKLSDGSYVYSGVYGYHAVAYANTILNSTASSAKAKSLVVAMLNYGAAAQVSFSYKTDALMNASLTAEQLALVDAYSDSMVAAVPTTSTDKMGTFRMNGGYSDIHPTVSFEGAFAINYYFTPNATPDDGVTFYYWDAATYNSVSVLTAANATGSVKMTSTTGEYTAAVEGIAAKAIDEPVFIAAVYTSGGTSYPTNIIGYSLGAYCKNLAANGNAFGAATAVYGYYAKAYFA